MQKTPISPDQRLNIAAMILAGMQAPGYVADTVERMAEIRESAIVQTDKLIEACDCETIHPGNNRWISSRPNGPKSISEVPVIITTFPVEDPSSRWEDTDEAHNVANQRD